MTNCRTCPNRGHVYRRQSGQWRSCLLLQTKWRLRVACSDHATDTRVTLLRADDTHTDTCVSCNRLCAKSPLSGSTPPSSHNGDKQRTNLAWSLQQELHATDENAIKHVCFATRSLACGMVFTRALWIPDCRSLINIWTIGAQSLVGSH